MHRQSKRIFLVCSLMVGLCLGTVLFWLYSPIRQELLFISSTKAMNQFESQWDFARQGWTLRRETIPWDQVLPRVTLAESIQKQVHKNTQIIVCDSIITVALAGEVETIKPEGNSTILTVGMGSVSGFDYLLVRGAEDQGWGAAGLAASRIADKTPLPTILLYSDNDRQAQIGAQLFSAHFTGGILDTLPRGIKTERQVQSTMNYIQDSKAMLIAVPYLTDLAHYVANDTVNGVRWIVDELYAPLIKTDKLEGMVFDDVYLSLVPLLQKEDVTISRELPLKRSYRSYGTKWRNWF